MKRQLFILCALFTAAHCSAMQINPATLLQKPYFHVFMANQPLTTANKQLWYEPIMIINNFVRNNSGGNAALTNSMNIVKQLSDQVLDIYDYMKNLTSMFGRLSGAEKREYNRQIQNQLDDMRSQLFIAKDMIMKQFSNQKQEVARQVLEQTIRFMEGPMMAQLQDNLNKLR